MIEAHLRRLIVLIPVILLVIFGKHENYTLLQQSEDQNKEQED